MRNLLIVLTAAAFGLAALPADAALTAKKVDEKVAGKSGAKKAGKAAPAQRGKMKGEAAKKDPK
jgi:hypothetical protein